jgi:hypothetical protein
MSLSARSNPIELSKIPFDPEYTAGARNAVNVCLRIQPNERVCVITDEATAEIAAAIVAELSKIGAPHHAYWKKLRSVRCAISRARLPTIWKKRRFRSLPCKCRRTNCARASR